jgi:hypothetical protein
VKLASVQAITAAFPTPHIIMNSKLFAKVLTNRDNQRNIRGLDGYTSSN